MIKDTESVCTIALAPNEALPILSGSIKTAESGKTSATLETTTEQWT